MLHNFCQEGLFRYPQLHVIETAGVCWRYSSFDKILVLIPSVATWVIVTLVRYCVILRTHNTLHEKHVSRDVNAYTRGVPRLVNYLTRKGNFVTKIRMQERTIGWFLTTLDTSCTKPRETYWWLRINSEVFRPKLTSQSKQNFNSINDRKTGQQLFYTLDSSSLRVSLGKP